MIKNPHYEGSLVSIKQARITITCIYISALFLLQFNVLTSRLSPLLPTLRYAHLCYLFTNKVLNPPVQLRLIPKLEEDLQVNEKGCKNQSF